VPVSHSRRRFVDSHLHLWDTRQHPWYKFPQPVERVAPIVDALAARRLVEHERALVAFVRLEHQHSHESLWPLQDFLASTRGEAAQ
jgi:hypothetical protein